MGVDGLRHIGKSSAGRFWDIEAMASKILGSHTVKATRGFAAQAAVKASPDFSVVPKEAVKTTTLSNGIVVSSIETNAPLSRIAIAYKAGSRNEAVAGTVHALRSASALSTNKTSQFALVRTLQEAGAAMTCTAGREHMMYAVDSSRQTIDATLEKLADAATAPAFKPWELADNADLMKLDLAGVSPQTTVLELLHKVAFRSGLGNSLFSPDHLVGKHTSEVMHNFVAGNFCANNAAVVGVGVPHGDLVAYANTLTLQSGAGSSAASKVNAGETRIEKGGAMSYVAVATEGASLSDSKNMMALALLQRVLGTGSTIKRGSGMGSKLNQAVQGAAAVTALNLNYSDAGLFGFMIAAPAAEAGKAVCAATKVLRSTTVNDGQLARAKAQLKSDLLMAEESTGNLLEELAMQALMNKGAVVNVADLVAAVDKLTVGDVNAVASRVAKGKLCVAALGNLSHVPYSDEL